MLIFQRRAVVAAAATALAACPRIFSPLSRARRGRWGAWGTRRC
jgi:hypothetical protein